MLVYLPDYYSGWLYKQRGRCWYICQTPTVAGSINRGVDAGISVIFSINPEAIQAISPSSGHPVKDLQMEQRALTGGECVLHCVRHLGCHMSEVRHRYQAWFTARTYQFVQTDSGEKSKVGQIEENPTFPSPSPLSDVPTKMFSVSVTCVSVSVTCVSITCVSVSITCVSVTVTCVSVTVFTGGFSLRSNKPLMETLNIECRNKKSLKAVNNPSSSLHILILVFDHSRGFPISEVEVNILVSGSHTSDKHTCAHTKTTDCYWFCSTQAWLNQHRTII
ncbi:hypothetical protein RRG08_052650 [Elysia crispata]|uniref:Uncharacterized protein n=1 Tax=Elysia crispata TaxID=231223 RepID=A0AAE0ZX52_9GAST|nr:hypothetical protein RRG08_052650 [Elysia crispata]